ncbi:N-acetyltransferase [Faecalibaculum rodentium]|mgnify:FL=1|uniref:N-acetyltransferase n=1 Tax=Faecalibaculum rodentium TaxID=1702221 RepID=UPI00258A61E6|nr:N-acetyltransferase [Faecalibaculum rodentium]
MIRKAETADLDAILNLYDQGRAIMRREGNRHQWTSVYPGPDSARQDLKAGHLYVNSQLTAVMTYMPGPDPTYQTMVEGSWLDESRYAVIHRIVSTEPGQGRSLLEYGMTCAGHLRIDTHSRNHGMKRLLTSLGFRRCGVILCQDGTPREAFEWSSADPDGQHDRKRSRSQTR